jgi:hypothetical protein
VGVAAAEVLASVVGAALAARTAGGSVYGVFLCYDVPLAVPALFAAGVTAQLAASLLPQTDLPVGLVAANVVMCCRIALAPQGAAALLWHLHERGAGRIRQGLTLLAGVWLETVFALLSVLGLLDVGLNLRHLARKRPDLVRPTSE